MDGWRGGERFRDGGSKDVQEEGREGQSWSAQEWNEPARLGTMECTAVGRNTT